MASSISSLGIGSGVLTADVIDQLKEADESRIVKPLENKITANNQKQDAYKLLDSLMKTFKASTSALSYDTIFDNKTVNSSGKAEVKIDAGSSVESFTLKTNELAAKHIQKFGSVASPESSISTVDGTLEIKIGSNPASPSKTLNVNYTAGMSLTDFAQAITEAAGDSVSASILKTGDGKYNLVLSSKSTGLEQTLNFSDSGGLSDSLLNAAGGYAQSQAAKDAEFVYNGITMSRPTNEISDLMLGLNIKLKEKGDESFIDVMQDSTAIVDEMQQFVDSYNALMTNLHDMTVKDKETGAQGVFNGDSFIKSISRDLSRTISSLNIGNSSLINFGIDVDRDGKMSFNKATLETKLTEDPVAVKEFFTGKIGGDGVRSTGFFTAMDDKMKSYTGYGKLLSNFETNLKSEGTNMSKSHAAAKASLDARYEIMTKRFTAYDGIISRINAQFSSLQMMINAEANSK